MENHFVDIVDTNDRIIGKDLKSSKFEKGFISRVVAILLCNKNGSFLVCKRADHKKNAPGLYDLAAFGNVIAGESYEKAARRELKEELDITCDLLKLDTFYQEIKGQDSVSKIFCSVFLGVSDTKPRLNHELVEVKEMSFEDIERDISENPERFCPGFINDFNKVKDKIRSL